MTWKYTAQFSFFTARQESVGKEAYAFNRLSHQKNNNDDHSPKYKSVAWWKVHTWSSELGGRFVQKRPLYPKDMSMEKRQNKANNNLGLTSCIRSEDLSGDFYSILFTVPCLMFYGIVTGSFISCWRGSAQWLHDHLRHPFSHHPIIIEQFNTIEAIMHVAKEYVTVGCDTKGLD